MLVEKDQYALQRVSSRVRARRIYDAGARGGGSCHGDHVGLFGPVAARTRLFALLMASCCPVVCACHYSSSRMQSAGTSYLRAIDDNTTRDADLIRAIQNLGAVSEPASFLTPDILTCPGVIFDGFWGGV